MTTEIIPAQIRIRQPIKQWMFRPGEVPELPNHGRVYGENFVEIVRVPEATIRMWGSRTPRRISWMVQTMRDNVICRVNRLIDYELEKCQGWYDEVYLVHTEGEPYITSTPLPYDRMQELTFVVVAGVVVTQF